MSTTTATATKSRWKSRAVTRLIEPGCAVYCAHCDDRIKFQARARHRQVICNVYVKGRWDRVEHYHIECYEAADHPFGQPRD